MDVASRESVKDRGRPSVDHGLRNPPKRKDKTMELEKMSKYARKQLAKRRGNWETPAAQVAVTVEMDVESVAQPPTPPKKKVWKEPPPPNTKRAHLNDLGNLPLMVAGKIRLAINAMREARELCNKIEQMSAKGLQGSEPRSIGQYLSATMQRAKSFELRAERILNV